MFGYPTCYIFGAANVTLLQSRTPQDVDVEHDSSFDQNRILRRRRMRLWRRTHDTVAGIPPFQGGQFNRSCTSPSFHKNIVRLVPKCNLLIYEIIINCTQQYTLLTCGHISRCKASQRTNGTYCLRCLGGCRVMYQSHHHCLFADGWPASHIQERRMEPCG
jgi:hypothetical protein